MFCNACGRELQPGEQYCTACGQPVGVAPIPRSINRVAHHVQLLSIFWIVYALLELMGSIIAMIFAAAVPTIVGAISGHPGVPVELPAFFLPVFLVVAIFLFFKSSLGLVAGWGLLQRRPWARILAIVAGVLVMMNIPFGTALGVYTFWTLFPPESQQEYEGMAKNKK